MIDRQPVRRARRLGTKLAASPVLPILGWTKVVESAVAGGPIANWALYAALVTLLWVFADDIYEAVESATDDSD